MIWVKLVFYPFSYSYNFTLSIVENTFSMFFSLFKLANIFSTILPKIHSFTINFFITHLALNYPLAFYDSTLNDLVFSKMPYFNLFLWFIYSWTIKHILLEAPSIHKILCDKNTISIHSSILVKSSMVHSSLDSKFYALFI